jgi:hypothetical protein
MRSAYPTTAAHCMVRCFVSASSGMRFAGCYPGTLSQLPQPEIQQLHAVMMMGDGSSQPRQQQRCCRAASSSEAYCMMRYVHA